MNDAVQISSLVVHYSGSGKGFCVIREYYIGCDVGFALSVVRDS